MTYLDSLEIEVRELVDMYGLRAVEAVLAKLIDEHNERSVAERPETA